MTGEAAKALEAFQNTLREALCSPREDSCPPIGFVFPRGAALCVAIAPSTCRRRGDHAGGAIVRRPRRASPNSSPNNWRLDFCTPEPQRSALAFFT